jgi:hypothetical protein
MSNIKALSIIIFSKETISLSENNNNYEFTYSKTGSIKYTGIYKPKYFKKEVLNTYKPIKIGAATLLLFTEDFPIGKKKCIRSILNSLIFSDEFKIKMLEENLTILNEHLSNY